MQGVLSATTVIQRDDPLLAATCVELPEVTVKGIKNAVKNYEVPWRVDSDSPRKDTASSQSIEPAKV